MIPLTHQGVAAHTAQGPLLVCQGGQVKPQWHSAQCPWLSFSPQSFLWSTLCASVSGCCHFQQLLLSLQLTVSDCLPWPWQSVSEAPVEWGSQGLLSKHSAMLASPGGSECCVGLPASIYTLSPNQSGQNHELLQPYFILSCALFPYWHLGLPCHLSCWVRFSCCRALDCVWGEDCKSGYSEGCLVGHGPVPQPLQVV